MSSVSYLEEYRRKYKPINAETTSPPTSHVQYSVDVQTLLSRYLNSESSLPVKTDGERTTGAADATIHTDTDVVEETKEKQSDSSCDDDLFDEDANNALLPTSAFADQRRITVDEVLRKDAELNTRHLRRHSSPTDSEKPYLKRLSRRSSSSPEGRRLLSDSKNPLNRRHSDMSLKSLNRQDSVLSTNSCESNGSNRSNLSYKNDILEFSDEDFDFDLEIDLNSSKLSDTDSQKLFSSFQLDTDSQKDSDSLAGYDEVDGSCVHCRPSSARSVASADSNNSLCTKCTSKNKERFETIKEISESEQSYFKDLLLIKEHFHDALLENGLLNPSEISAIFGNIGRITAVSQKFCDHLSQHLQQLQSEGDNCYNSAAIGQLICETSAMFLAFEAYCSNYSNAVSTIDQLRKDNQLFNLFLEASQNDNAALRRMDLKTFLMLPVQRVMKYPLLLKRLHKATYLSHPDREAIEKANDKLTNILHHINAQSKVLSSMFVSPKDGKPTKRTSFEIALTKLVLNFLNWKHDEIHFLNSGKVGYLQPASDSQWTEKLRTLRLNTAYAVLVTKGKRDRLPKKAKHGRLLFPQVTAATDAALLIVKKGNSRLQVIGDPLYLGRCLVARNSEFYDVFEIARDYIKETFIIRPVNSSDIWYIHLKYYSMVLGGRNTRRRNALPNILLQP